MHLLWATWRRISLIIEYTRYEKIRKDEIVINILRDSTDADSFSFYEEAESNVIYMMPNDYDIDFGRWILISEQYIREETLTMGNSKSILQKDRNN